LSKPKAYLAYPSSLVGSPEVERFKERLRREYDVVDPYEVNGRGSRTWSWPTSSRRRPQEIFLFTVLFLSLRDHKLASHKRRGARSMGEPEGKGNQGKRRASLKGEPT